MQTQLTGRDAAERAGAGSRQHPARLCSLRILYRNRSTYQLLGDELDGPRGRIYLIKQVLEGNDVTLKTQEHLDRCLTCRNCETTCPSVCAITICWISGVILSSRK